MALSFIRTLSFPFLFVGTANCVVLVDLMVDEVYLVVVRAATSKGMGQASDQLELKAGVVLEQTQGEMVGIAEIHMESGSFTVSSFHSPDIGT